VKTRFGVEVGKCSMGSSATKSQGNIREFYIDWRVVTLKKNTIGKLLRGLAVSCS